MAPLNSVQMQAAVFSLVVSEVWWLQAVCSRILSALRRSEQEERFYEDALIYRQLCSEEV